MMSSLTPLAMNMMLGSVYIAFTFYRIHLGRMSQIEACQPIYPQKTVTMHIKIRYA